MQNIYAFQRLSTGLVEIQADEIRLLNSSARKLGITAKNFDKVLKISFIFFV